MIASTNKKHARTFLTMRSGVNGLSRKTCEWTDLSSVLVIMDLRAPSSVCVYTSASVGHFLKAGKVWNNEMLDVHMQSLSHPGKGWQAPASHALQGPPTHAQDRFLKHAPRFCPKGAKSPHIWATPSEHESYHCSPPPFA